jgi:hypothetical protein
MKINQEEVEGQLSNQIATGKKATHLQFEEVMSMMLRQENQHQEKRSADNIMKQQITLILHRIVELPRMNVQAVAMHKDLKAQAKQKNLDMTGAVIEQTPKESKTQSMITQRILKEVKWVDPSGVDHLIKENNKESCNPKEGFAAEKS